MDTRSDKEKLKELSKENELENRLKETIKKMRCKKRERSKENKKRTKEMRAALIEIQNENMSIWKKRRKLHEKTRKENEEVERLSLERMKRKNIGESKKKEILRESRSKENKMAWINEKKGHWRNYREKNDESIFKVDVTNVKGSGENVVDKCLNNIVEIGQKVELKMKETVFKKTFADLKKSEYLRQEMVNFCKTCHNNLPSKLSEACLYCLKTESIQEQPYATEPFMSEGTDDELDLLTIMSSWPELFETTGKQACPLVMNDLINQRQMKNLNHPTRIKSIDRIKKSIKQVNRCESNVKLVRIKCYVERYYVSGTDLINNLSSNTGDQCHLTDEFLSPKSVQIDKPGPKNINDLLILNSKKSHNKKSPSKKIKSKTKKISPKKPLKIKEFLDKIKAKRMSSRSKSEYKANLALVSTINKNTPRETIATNEAKEDQNIAKIDNISVGFNENIDCALKFSEKSDHIRHNSPLKIQPNPSENMVNLHEYPGSFSELKSYDKLSSNLVGTANFYKVAEPSVGNIDLNMKRKYKLKKKVKKEEDLARESSNTILNYFPKASSSRLCIAGKRKSSNSSTEVLKKPRVGNTTTD